MAPGAGSRLRTVATTRLPLGDWAASRPRRHTTVKNDASPTQRPETATLNVAGRSRRQCGAPRGVDEMSAKLTAENRLNPPEPVSS
jgi:hypothetical protein